MNRKDHVARNSFVSSIEVHQKSLDVLVKGAESAALICVRAYANDKKVVICGNGGSAADAQHFAAELVGRYLVERKALSAIALTTNSSSLTAIGNDYGYDKTFSRQLEAYGRKGDVLFCISTSGNSKNCVEAAKLAKRIGLKTIAFTGCGGGILKKVCDISLVVPSDSTPRIQEVHILVIHIICEIIEKHLFSK